MPDFPKSLISYLFQQINLRWSMREDIINAYSRLYGQLNKETREHSLSVAEICEICAIETGLCTETGFKIGYLHDVGKIFIPARILKKNMKLNPVEREMVDLHSYFGYRLLVEAGEPAVITLPVLFHHGFRKPRLLEPEEMITEEILRYTFLVHTVDIFDAMARTRAYHVGYEKDRIFDVLNEDPMCMTDILPILSEIPVQKRN